MLSNPPFGVEWKKVEKAIRAEAETRGYSGRFGAGLPRVSDGSLLFVQHMISKFNRDGSPSRIAVVLNGSPLFTGSAGSGESEIRRWIIENDWLEAIVALPNDLFYNTGIATYLWIITNQKSPQRRDRIQLIHAVDRFQKMRKSLSSKRNELSVSHIDEITRWFGEFAESETCRLFDNADFGFQRITVERPLRLNFQVSSERFAGLCESNAFTKLESALQDKILTALRTLDENRLYKDRDEFIQNLEKALKSNGAKLSAAQIKILWSGLSERDETADICMDSKGQPEADPDLRDYENVPLKENIEDYFEREVLPHVPDAWIDHSKTKIGYEIPFNRHFYKYVPPRPLNEIDADLKKVTAEILALLNEVVGG
jgi:type I restriction enzyme M protein